MVFTTQVIHIVENLYFSGMLGQACEQTGGYQDNIRGLSTSYPHFVDNFM
jgi:hypothetical protein